jgi:hypothetical protein
MVYLPMAYLYGKKFVGPITSTILAIREEIYDSSYEKIDWSEARRTCAKVYQIPCCFYVFYLPSEVLSMDFHKSNFEFSFFCVCHANHNYKNAGWRSCLPKMNFLTS